MSLKIKKILSIIGLCVLVFANICFLCQPVLNIGKYKASVNYEWTEPGFPNKSDITYSFKNGVCFQTEKIYYNGGQFVPKYKIKHNQDIYRLLGNYGYIGTEEFTKESNGKKYDKDYEFKTKSIFAIEITTNIASKKLRLINATAIIIQIILLVLIVCNTLYIVKLYKTKKGEAPK